MMLSSSQALFLEPEDPLWMQALNACGYDFYHLPAYVRLEADWLQANPVAFLYRSGVDVMLLPLLERVTPGGLGYDAVTPYGYSPPVFSPCATSAFRLEALAAFQSAARARGLLSTFLRLHPLLVPAIDEIGELKEGVWMQEDRGYTVDMPLDVPDDAWMRRIARSHANASQIRSLRRAGATVIMDTEFAWEVFADIYKVTMQRLNVGKNYLYTKEYLDKFRSGLDGIAHCAAVLDTHGNAMCAGIFTLTSGVVEYHLSGTNPSYSKQAPIKFLLAEMRQWALEHQAVSFHLGGGVGAAQDSLFTFKKSFGGREFPFRTISAIHDQERYRKECELKNLSGDEDGFFPAYRRPVGSSDAD